MNKLVSKLGFQDADYNLMAYVEGVASFRLVRLPTGGSTLAVKIDDDIVARIEDVNGSRFVVNIAKVTIVDVNRVARATLGDDGVSFVASFIVVLDDFDD